MNLTGQSIREKTGRAAKEPAHLARVRELPCVICDAFGEVQLSPTTAHHPIHERGGNLKVPDHEAIPLCDGYHQGTFGRTKLAIHRSPKKWREKYGKDGDYTAVTLDRLGV